MNSPEETIFKLDFDFIGASHFQNLGSTSESCFWVLLQCELSFTIKLVWFLLPGVLPVIVELKVSELHLGIEYDKNIGGICIPVVCRSQIQTRDKSQSVVIHAHLGF
jgi:hypothetical protein